jgi:LysR family hydrogen peroxide-inducible transcriptional activator
MKFAPLPLTLRQLQYVVAVAETQGFRRAADLCRVSQPSLSAQIAEVEAALGAPLFDRSRRHVPLTAAGAAVVDRARRILVETEDLLDAASSHVDPLAGTLRLGVIPTIGPYLLPELDPALRAAFPGLTLVWNENRTEALVRHVITGDLDAALLAREANLGDLEHAIVGWDEFVLAASTDHSLGHGRRPARLADLTDVPTLLLEDGHCFREQALALCSRAGARELGFRATSLATLCQMVAGGAGVTLLPRLAVDVENRRGQLAIRNFVRPAPCRTIVLAWRHRSPLAESLRAVAEAARDLWQKAGFRRTGRAAPSSHSRTARR